jgi:hypothetical protein
LAANGGEPAPCPTNSGLQIRPDDLDDTAGSTRAAQVARVLVEKAMREKYHFSAAVIAQAFCPLQGVRHLLSWLLMQSMRLEIDASVSTRGNPA